jgi:hypothetical protein
MPEVRVRRDVVHDPLVLREIPGVRTNDLPIEQVDVPARLVELAVVRVIASDDRELHGTSRGRTALHLPHLGDHRIADLHAQQFLRPIRAGEVRQTRDAAVAVEILEARR